MTGAVLVPGYNEPEGDLTTLCDGRHGIDGLSQAGFACTRFPREGGDLRVRIDAFRAFLLDIEARGTLPLPLATVGYSAGGLVVRGFLRAYPDDAARLVSHTVQIGTLNWGITADFLPLMTGLLHIPDTSVGEFDLRSDFMTWLNGTSGHWAHRDDGFRFWQLDREPWTVPPGTKLLSIYGRVPSFGDDNDGIVWADSATLGGRLTAHPIRHEHANHLNLVGLFNLGTLLLKRFIVDDHVWPQVVAAIVQFVRTDTADDPPDARNAEDPLDANT